MPTLAYFGIESSGLSLAVDLLILFVVVLYLSLIYWTYADARRRIYDPMLVGCATAASLFPFVGTIVYLILRPPEYLEDVRERELEMQAAEARLHDLDHGLCPHCDYRVERDFIRCPSCLRKLKERCVSCSRPLDQAWTICPYCEAEVPGCPPPRRGGDAARPRRSRAISASSRRRPRVRTRPRRGARAGAAPARRSSRAIWSSTFRRPPRRQLSRTPSRRSQPSPHRRGPAVARPPPEARSRPSS